MLNSTDQIITLIHIKFPNYKIIRNLSGIFLTASMTCKHNWNKFASAKDVMHNSTDQVITLIQSKFPVSIIKMSAIYLLYDY